MSETVPIERFRELVKTNEKHYQELCTLRTQLAEKEAESAVMREACQKGLSALDKLMGDSDLDSDDSPEMQACQLLSKSLSTSAGKAFLARMEEAERRVKQLEGFKVESSVILDERDKLKVQLEEAVRLLSEQKRGIFTLYWADWNNRRDTLLEQLKGGL